MKILLTAVMMLATTFAYADEVDDLKKNADKINAQIEASQADLARLEKQAADAEKKTITPGRL